MAEVQTNPPRARTVVAIAVAVLVGVVVGSYAASSGRGEIAAPTDAQLAEETASVAESGGSVPAGSPTPVTTVVEPDLWFDEPCESGPLGEGNILSFVTETGMYLSQYDETAEELTGCLLDEGFFPEPPIWSFDGQRAAWIGDGQVELWERSTGARGSVPHTPTEIVAAPLGFAYWDDDADEIVEVSPIPERFPVRTAVQAVPDGWWDCDRRETEGCIGLALEAVVATGDYIFMRRDPGGSLAGSIWLSRVTADGNLWTYPNDFSNPQGVIGSNIRGEVSVDLERDVVDIVAGFSCGTSCSTPSFSLVAVDLATGDVVDSPYELPPPPPERVWRVDDFDARQPAAVVISDLPNGQWFGSNAFPDFALPELFVHDGTSWIASGFVAQTADRSDQGQIAFADTEALYIFNGTELFPNIDDLVGRWEGEVRQVAWAPSATTTR